MSGRGDSETVKLRANVESQLNRLLTQLQDIEEMKNELDEEEYISSRQETIDQMKEFEVSLEKMTAGNITLVDDLGSVQLAIQAAIRNAFKSPEVIRMFAKKENGALRSKLAGVEADYKLGRIQQEAYISLAFEIVMALEKLGEPLSSSEQAILNQKTRNLSDYVEAGNEVDVKVSKSSSTK